MLFWTGTANVENGSATVSVDVGPALTAEVAAQYSMAVLDGIVYFVDSLTDTSTFELTRNYAGATGTVSLEIWPVSPEVSDLVRLAQVVARTQAQINVLDKNSQGLFFQMKGVTGAADPGPGFVAFDHGDAASVSEAYIDVLDANGRAVAGLLGLWEAGTTLVLRSLTTTAYRAYAVASFTDEGGWVRLGLAYLGHDGVLADNEALALSWTRAAAGLAIDATGFFVDRDDYDDRPGGFVFLSADGDGTPGSPPSLYRKASAAAGDWGPAVPFQGPQGEKGWAPLLGLANDGARRVLRLTDYVGGEGAKPSGVGQYLSAGGLTSNIANAMDVRGPQGLSAYAVAVANGFSGDEPSWLASLVGASAYQVAVANGFVGDQTAWLTSLIGRDGTDPGALFNWDDATADADPGAGKMRADNADLASAGFLFVSKSGRTGDSLEAFLLAIGGSTNTVKGHVTLTSSGGSDQAIVGVTGLVNAGAYVKIALQSGSHSGVGTFPEGDPVSLQFSRAGNQGAVDAISLASTINGATEKPDPVPADIALLTDSEDGNVIKKVSLENLGKAISPPSGEVVAKSANYTVVEDDNGNVIAVDAAAAARTITLLPAAVAGNGFKLVVKKIDSSANIVTVAADGSETIDGEVTRVLRMQNQSTALVCDGVAWQVMGEGTVFESGSNANGSFTRFSDGTQICTHRGVSMGGTNSIGAVHRTDEYIWTFPALFSSAPNGFAGSANTSGLWGGGVFATTGVSGAIRLYSPSSQSSTEGQITAIGRWF